MFCVIHRHQSVQIMVHVFPQIAAVCCVHWIIICRICLPLHTDLHWLIEAGIFCESFRRKLTLFNRISCYVAVAYSPNSLYLFSLPRRQNVWKTTTLHIFLCITRYWGSLDSKLLFPCVQNDKNCLCAARHVRITCQQCVVKSTQNILLVLSSQPGIKHVAMMSAWRKLMVVAKLCTLWCHNDHIHCLNPMSWSNVKILIWLDSSSIVSI